MKLKKLIPRGLKVRLRRAQTGISDLLSLRLLDFVRPTESRRQEGGRFKERICITQPINKSQWAAPKIHNINLAVSSFQDLAIHPGEIFSFWRMAGEPIERNGYQRGINIINDRLDFDIGGGLCQLSGLLYHLAITAGLGIVQRFPHSVDLYTDQTRYTPLGADATVVYGYKDLRIRNNLECPLCFRISVEGYSLRGALCAPQEVMEYEILFDREDFKDGKRVKTIRQSGGREREVLAESVYSNSSHSEII